MWRTKKRVLSLLLVLCMVMGMLPATALAAGDEENIPPIAEGSAGSKSGTASGYPEETTGKTGYFSVEGFADAIRPLAKIK